MAEGLYASDHQYLEKFTGKYFSVAPTRLQRLLLTVQLYEFEIKYIPGKKAALAEAVHRVIPQEEMELKGLDFTI